MQLSHFPALVLAAEQRPPRLLLLRDVTIKVACNLLALFCLVVLLVCVVWALGHGTEAWSKNGGYAIAFMWCVLVCV